MARISIVTLILSSLLVISCASDQIIKTEEPLNRVVSETLIARVNFSSIVKDSLVVSPDGKRVAYVAMEGNKWFAVVDQMEGKPYDRIVTSTPVFSPDSQRVAYGARTGNRISVVVDGKEGKRYAGMGAGVPVFSPDSKRVAYEAVLGNKRVIVVDGIEGNKYDGIFNLQGGRIIFDSADKLHYLAQKGSEIYLVEETVR